MTMEKHHGSCHCGAVAFEVVSDFSSPYRCNCSFCIRRGATMQRVPASNFLLLRGEDAVGLYGGRDFAKHYFCKTCGIPCFTRIYRGQESEVAVNVGCVDDVDWQALVPDLFDGAHLL
ncbi:hypothetical protein CBW56_09075 [Denitratisoma oestradiolicum]|nr:hypothetical protein CBW56_09075 [Denitratisoma oestradiolicum]